MDISDIMGNLQLSDSAAKRMLGIFWDPSDYVLWFSVRITLSIPKKKTHSGPDL